MQLATFTEDDRTRIGAVVGDEIADLTAAGLPADMRALIAGGPEALTAASGAVGHAPRVALDAVRLRAPVQPPKFLAVGLNSRDHRREITAGNLLRNLDLVRLGIGSKFAHPRSRYPLFFPKATSCVTGPRDPIWIPRDEPTLDYEGELCVVIGRRCRRLTEEEAAEAIFGYTITNDLSVRGWQLDSPMGPVLAKGFETHGPLGPVILTADERPNGDFALRTTINGEQRQEGNTGELIQGPHRLVSILSQFCTLEPGDVLALGTFAGVALFTHRYLAPGDIVRVEVDGIGHLENRVVMEP
ncbi:MAG: fumarylacetoacetate hydrolase family protein [Solirubrobacteraceae bacterium]